MKINQAKAENFGSYEKIEFDFTNQGLTLISGPTGSGKSTLCDVVPWILFGVTAKGGSVEEVISWPGDKVTEGTVYLDNVTISRKRGPKSKDNDLMFWPVDGEVTRGKDLNDTQRLINDFLGVTAEQYLLGAYFHEFSETSRFFTTTAKNRRQLTENICDFTIPNKIKEAAKEKVKNLRTSLKQREVEIASLDGQARAYDRQMQHVSQENQYWVKQQADKLVYLMNKCAYFDEEKRAAIADLKRKSKKFDDEKHHYEFELRKQINGLTEKSKGEQYYDDVKARLIEAIAKYDDDICPTCGSPKGSVEKMALTEELYDMKSLEQENLQLLKQIKQLNKDRDKALAAVNPYLDQLKREQSKENTYTEQIRTLEEEVNPYYKQFNEARRQHVTVLKEIEVLQRKNDDLKVEISDLELLIELTDVYRSSLVKSAVLDLERKTNNYLTEHFDAEIKVKFELVGADRLEVQISKDGNDCAYTQLSKGQRQLLKLCFGVSVMKAVQNFFGVDFNMISLDEFADGLDEQMKVKSFGLLNKLAVDYDSVFAIDHSEPLKALFTNRYNVELVNGVSQIAEA